MTIQEPASPSIETERAEALKWLQAKQDFGRHLVSYVPPHACLRQRELPQCMRIPATG